MPSGMFVMIAIAVCSTLQIFLLTKRVCTFLPSRPSAPRRGERSKNVQPLGVFAQPPLLLLRQLRVILLRRSSVLPVVPLPHRTRDETEGQPHENFLIHVHALRCEWSKTDQSVNHSLSVSHAFMFRVLPASQSWDEAKHTSHHIDPLRASRGRQTRASAASISKVFSIVF